MKDKIREIDNIIWHAKYQKKRNWIKSIQILKDALKKWPDDSELHRTIADTYEYKKLFRKAISHYQEVLNMIPDDDNVLFHIANCFLRLSEFYLAIEYYNQIKKYLIEAEYNKAIAYNRLKQPKKSIQILRSIVNNDISNDTPFYFLIEQLINTKNYNDAIFFIHKVKGKFGYSKKVQFLEGFCNFKIGKYLKAYVNFVELEKENYHNANFYRVYGLTCSKINKNDKAINLLEKSLKHDPFSFYSYIDIINLLIDKRDFIRAKKIIAQAVKMLPNNPTMTLLKKKIEFFLRNEE